MNKNKMNLEIRDEILEENGYTMERLYVQVYIRGMVSKSTMASLISEISDLVNVTIINMENSQEFAPGISLN